METHDPDLITQGPGKETLLPLTPKVYLSISSLPIVKKIFL